MKGHSTWSFRPYRPLLTEVGDPYICRVAPGRDGITLDWLGGRASVFCRERGTGEFSLCGEGDGTFVISGLREQTDYEFYAARGEAKSRVRLARTGEVIGTVVNYLHPDDEAYAFSGRYLCSPSLLKHPDGYLLASMDVYAGKHPQNLTFIFRSDDDGANWYYVTDLMPCFWGKLFLHRGDVYMLACSTEYGDLLIARSPDGGMSFPAPTVLLRGANGKNGSCGVHKNPQIPVEFQGRLYETLEWGKGASYGYAAMVMSCAAEDDLTRAENWSFSSPLRFGAFTPELAGLPQDTLMIEGALAVTPQGKLLNIMRLALRGRVLALNVDTKNPDAPLAFESLIALPTSCSKFSIRYDIVSGRYFTIIDRMRETSGDWARNLLSLMTSRDLYHWDCVCDLIDKTDEPELEVGFQYVDFDFDGNDLIFLCRTAYNRAHNFHDSNYSTFHRLKDFRVLLKSE